MILVLAVWLFYLGLRAKGGSGVRTDGRTIVDKPGPDEDPPPN